MLKNKRPRRGQPLRLMQKVSDSLPIYIYIPLIHENMTGMQGYCSGLYSNPG